MDKTGELKEGQSRCDFCGCLACTVDHAGAHCSEHAAVDVKTAEAKQPKLASFTVPLEGS